MKLKILKEEKMKFYASEVTLNARMIVAAWYWQWFVFMQILVLHLTDTHMFCWTSVYYSNMKMIFHNKFDEILFLTMVGVNMTYICGLLDAKQLILLVVGSNSITAIKTRSSAQNNCSAKSLASNVIDSSLSSLSLSSLQGDAAGGGRGLGRGRGLGDGEGAGDISSTLPYTALPHSALP